MKTVRNMVLAHAELWARRVRCSEVCVGDALQKRVRYASATAESSVAIAVNTNTNPLRAKAMRRKAWVSRRCAGHARQTCARRASVAAESSVASANRRRAKARGGLSKSPPNPLRATALRGKAWLSRRCAGMRARRARGVQVAAESSVAIGNHKHEPFACNGCAGRLGFPEDVGACAPDVREACKCGGGELCRNDKHKHEPFACNGNAQEGLAFQKMCGACAPEMRGFCECDGGATCRARGTHGSNGCSSRQQTSTLYRGHCKACALCLCAAGCGRLQVPGRSGFCHDCSEQCLIGCACMGGEPCGGVHGSCWVAAENPSSLPPCSGRALPGKRCDLCETRHSRIATFFREQIRIDAGITQNDLSEADADAESQDRGAVGLETFRMKWQEQQPEPIELINEVADADGRWEGLFRVGKDEVSVQLLESDAERALRLGLVATEAEACPPSKQVVLRGTATYTVGEERFEIQRADRRRGGAGYKGDRAALKDEALQAIHNWQKIQILSSQAMRIAPEQRTLVDDALDVMLQPKKLVLESTSRFTGGKTWRKYVYHGDLGKDVHPPAVWVEETHWKGEQSSQKYDQDKQKVAWCNLFRQLRRRVLCGEILLSVGREYWRHVLQGPVECIYKSKKCQRFEAFGRCYYTDKKDGKEDVVKKVMAAQRRVQLGGQQVPVQCYPATPGGENDCLEELPQMDQDFQRQERAEQHADFFEYLNSFEWFHCRDGCRRRFYFTRAQLPSRRVACMPGEKLHSTDAEGLPYRRDSENYELTALSHCVTPSLDNPPNADECGAGLCKRLEGWRLWNWRMHRVMSFDEEDAFRAREAAWSTDEKWQSQVCVREQLTKSDYAICHQQHGAVPCRYAATDIFCTDCAVFHEGADRSNHARRRAGADGGTAPPRNVRSVVNWRGKENQMWKGRVVNVLAGMRPLTEMAIAQVHVVMQIWTLRSTGQLVCSGHVCNVPVMHPEWAAELPRRPEHCKLLLIDRRTPTKGARRGKRPKPFRTSYDEVLLALRAAYEFNERYRRNFKRATQYSPLDDSGKAIPIRIDTTWVQVSIEDDWTWIGLAPGFIFSEENLNAWGHDGAAACLHVVEPEAKSLLVFNVFEKWYDDCELLVARTVREWWRSQSAEAGSFEADAQTLWANICACSSSISVETIRAYLVDNEVPFDDANIETLRATYASCSQSSGRSAPSRDFLQNELAKYLVSALADELACAAAAFAMAAGDATEEAVVQPDAVGDFPLESYGLENDVQATEGWHTRCENEIKSRLGIDIKSKGCDARVPIDEPGSNCIGELAGASESDPCPTDAMSRPTRLVKGIPVMSMPRFADAPPLDEGSYGVVLDAFPSVFNEGICDIFEPRLVDVEEERYWENTFKQDDWAASVHPRLPYWVWDRSNRRKLSSYKNFYIKRTPNIKRWTPELIRKYGIHNIVKRMIGFTQDIPGSAGEMMKLRFRLTAMINQIYADTGKLPLLFSTITSANSHWWHLHRLLPTRRIADEGARHGDEESHTEAENEIGNACEGSVPARSLHKRNWVVDAGAWGTCGSPNGDSWDLPTLQVRRSAVRRFPMAVAWFGQMRLELVRRYVATELCNVTDSYDVSEWSKTGGNLHKHSIDWTVDSTPLDLDSEMQCLQTEVAKRVEAGCTDARLHLRGVTEFIKIAEAYVSEWNECKGADGQANELAREVREYVDRGDHPAAVSHADLMYMCGRNDAVPGVTDVCPGPTPTTPLSLAEANDSETEARPLSHTDAARRRRRLHIAALSQSVCMHDMHRPHQEGPPHAAAACARVVGANEDVGDPGHIVCANGYPMELVRRFSEERIEPDDRRPDLFHARLARNCKLAVGGNKHMRFASGSNEATKIITHRRGAVDYVAKYQTDPSKAGGGEHSHQQEVVRALDKMEAAGKTFGAVLTPTFMKMMGNEAYPITKVFHYLLRLPTAHFSRDFKNLFLQGTFASDDGGETLQPLANACEEGVAGSSKADTSDVARYEERGRRFNVGSDTRIAAAAMLPGTVPFWARHQTIADLLPTCTLAEFLRLMQPSGRNLHWRASPLILNVRPFLSLRFGGKKFVEHARYALLLYKPDAKRREIEGLSDIQIADALMQLVSAQDSERRHAYIRNLVREQNEQTTHMQALLEPLEGVEDKSDGTGSDDSEYEVQVSVGFDGTVKHRRCKKVRAKKLTLEERLRAEMREAMAAQSRSVTEDWMERSAENHYGSKTVFAADSDDEGVSDEKETVAELHAIKFYGGEIAVNHLGLSCETLLQRHGVVAKEIDWAAIKDQVKAETANEEVTETLRTQWDPNVLDPTQRLLHDYVTRTWLYGATCDYLRHAPLRDLSIKEFGTAGSGKTRLNRTMVVSVRYFIQCMRDLLLDESSTAADASTATDGGATPLRKAPANLSWGGLEAALINVGFDTFATVLRADKDIQKQASTDVANKLLQFGACARVRLAAFTGVAAMTLGLGARTITSQYRTGVRKFKPQLDGNAALELQSAAGLGESILDLVDEISFVGRATFGKMDHRKQEARAEWLKKVGLAQDDPRRRWGNSGRILSGDPSQLPPIGELEIIDDSTPGSEYDQKGRDEWRSITDVIQLWRCHRQKGDATYAEECLRLRDGTFTEADWRSWMKRDLARGEFTDDERAKFERGNALDLTGTNAKCGLINGRRAISRICSEWPSELPQDARGIYRFKAEQSNEASKMRADHFSGLRSTTHFVVSAPHMKGAQNSSSHCKINVGSIA